MERRNLILGSIYGISAAAIWGGMYVVSDVTLTVIPPFTLLSLRIVLGILALLPFAWRAGAALPSRRATVHLLAVGALGLGISLGAQFAGTDLSTAVNGALVTSASPAFVTLFAIFILRERLTLPRLLAVLLASAGVMLIVDPASADFREDTFAGDIFLAIAAVTWGLYSVLVRFVSLKRQLHSLTVTIFALFGGLLFSLPASLHELTHRSVGSVDGGILLGVAYLGFVSTALALLLWNRAFRPRPSHHRLALLLRPAPHRRPAGCPLPGSSHDA